ncbi:MAG TPA: NADH-quinone oxidoreductase subunit M, partial [Limnochordia bacterium]|nr:NADH-quinone oxidoreductase subunit M [Limnochordia bacterium]
MLTLIIAVPLLGALCIALCGRNRPQVAQAIAIASGLADGLLAIGLALGFRSGDAQMQWAVQADWLPSIGASYHLGVDGISLPL